MECIKAKAPDVVFVIELSFIGCPETRLHVNAYVAVSARFENCFLAGSVAPKWAPKQRIINSSNQKAGLHTK